ncbi:MAG: 3-hydroxyacyl-CoA dehydrogenase family protein [Promethearchaeota archaeon]
MTNEIKNVSIIGAGIMGKQITGRAINYGFNLALYDVSSEALKQAEKYIEGIIKRSKNKAALGTINYYNILSEAVKSADLVIEAVPEELKTKKEVFSQIEKAAPPKAIIATNSSSIPVSKIEDAVERKENLLNLHFYMPIPLRNMVDIMRGTKTSNETFEKGKEWIEKIDCVPLVVKKECLGFVFNRIWHAVKKECLKIWAGGHADFEVVDKAWKIFSGMSMGPFTMMDGVGLDVVYDIEMSYYNESGDPKDKPPQALKELVDNGELGLKAGKGFYTYRRKKKR